MRILSKYPNVVTNIWADIADVCRDAGLLRSYEMDFYFHDLMAFMRDETKSITIRVREYGSNILAINDERPVGIEGVSEYFQRNPGNHLVFRIEKLTQPDDENFHLRVCKTTASVKEVMWDYENHCIIGEYSDESLAER